LEAAPASATAPAGAIPPDDIAKLIAAGYRAMMKDGEPIYCRRQKVTGSLTKVVESCLTQAQIKDARENGQEFWRRMTTTPGAPASVDANGGTQPSAVNP
jgi:hypothetical protein